MILSININFTSWDNNNLIEKETIYIKKVKLKVLKNIYKKKKKDLRIK